MCDVMYRTAHIEIKLCIYVYCTRPGATVKANGIHEIGICTMYDVRDSAKRILNDAEALR